MFLLLSACVHTVDISLAAAEIAPTMANGVAWDGPDNVLGALAPADAGALAAAFGALTGSPEAGKAVVGVAAQLQKPDAGGGLEFIPGSGEPAVTATVPEVSDSASPRWAPGAATVRSVALRGSSSLRISLFDRDLRHDDPIGVVVLTGAQLGRALGRDGVFTVETAEQTSGQLLSVSVLVVNAAK
jgi:hypothetical protein